jgi:dTDP-4-dehydrorhamnose reductase
MLAFAFKNDDFFKDYISLDLPECDIADYQAVDYYIKKHRPEYLINCAAYTNVTRAEDEPDIALRVNAIGTKNLAQLSIKHNVKLIHFSTDYVFKGDKNIEYYEDSQPDPVNEYGLSKLKGEQFLQELIPDALIIRVSWLYGPSGKNFVSIISKLMQEKEELKLVCDQYAKSTYTIDVVGATINMIKSNCKGIYHFANEGVCSRFDFTLKIYDILKSIKNINCKITPIKAYEYDDFTPRPTYSILCTDKYKFDTKKIIRHWEDALKSYISDLVPKGT